MSDTVKLIIEIPADVYRTVHKHKSSILTTKQDDQEIVIGVRKGIPLDDVKAEIEKEIIPRNSDDYDHDVMFQNCGLRIALKIIDNIGKGDK